MTIIAWDGVTLAADKQATSDGFGIKVTKIFRRPYGLVGLSGHGPVACAILGWLDGIRDPREWPSEYEGVEVIVINIDWSALGYSMNPYPMLYEDRCIAIGCGANFARAAMHLGHGSIRAVEVACALDIMCGMGIDAIKLIED